MGKNYAVEIKSGVWAGFKGEATTGGEIWVKVFGSWICIGDVYDTEYSVL